MIPMLILNTVLKDASVHLQVRIHSLPCPGLGLSVFLFWGRAVTNFNDKGLHSVLKTLTNNMYH